MSVLALRSASWIFCLSSFTWPLSRSLAARAWLTEVSMLVTSRSQSAFLASAFFARSSLPASSAFFARSFQSALWRTYFWYSASSRL